jgi:hypothetical protein
MSVASGAHASMADTSKVLALIEGLGIAADGSAPGPTAQSSATPSSTTSKAPAAMAVPAAKAADSKVNALAGSSRVEQVSCMQA